MASAIPEMSTTWDGFKSLFTGMPYQTLLFRGHSDDRWRLAPSFFREGKKSGITLADYAEEALRDAYHHMSHDLPRAFDLALLDDLCSFLSVLQNHGFPTPLLDWTYSPYIAAYFAFREVNIDHPRTDLVRIFVLDAKAWAAASPAPAALAQSAPFVAIVRPPAQFNARLIPQQGAFTLSNIPGLEEYIMSAAPEASPAWLNSVTINVKHTIEALGDLDSMGINEQTLFPGLDGACRAMKRRYFSPRAVGVTAPEAWRKLMRRLKAGLKGTAPT